MALVVDGGGTITGLVAGGLPDASITQADLASGVAGNGPLFHVWQASQQTISHATDTKILLTSVLHDTSGSYDTTNSRFRPNVAGYYHITCQTRWQDDKDYNSQYIMLYKNGTLFRRGIESDLRAASSYDRYVQAQSSFLVYLNGSTDYIESWTYTTINGGGTWATGYSVFEYSNTMFGYLVRAA